MAAVPPDHVGDLLGMPVAAPVNVTCRQLNPIDVWVEKEDLMAKEQASWKLWNCASDDERVGVLLLVQDQLKRLTDRVDAWVPASLQRQDGDRIDVTITFYLPEVAAATLRARVEVERTRQLQAERLLELRRELGAT